MHEGSEAAREVGGVAFDGGLGVPNASSTRGQTRFIVVRGAEVHGFHCDDDVRNLVASGLVGQYTDRQGGLIQAYAFSEAVAVTLFMDGIDDIEASLAGGVETETFAAVSSILRLCMSEEIEFGVVDFRSAGKIWALTGRAMGRDLRRERDPEAVARRLHQEALKAADRREEVDPAIVFGEGDLPDQR